MTPREAEIVVRILCRADGGCSTCASHLVELFGEHFPEHKEIANRVWRDEFERDYEWPGTQKVDEQSGADRFRAYPTTGGAMNYRTIFGSGYLHRLGHLVTGLLMCVGATLLVKNVTVGWLIGCEVLPRLLEAIDLYAGGLLVGWEERKRYWRDSRDREFRITSDTLNDLWEYRLAWLLYPIALFVL